MQILSRNEYNHGELLRLMTAGSVDDGKSTLIGRLLHDAKSIPEDQLAAVARSSRRRGIEGLDLSLLTDGLLAEREQGITIDVAYRYFSTPKRKFIITDVPGHEQYTRNMVTAASTASLAVLLVDARKGIVLQSRRHAYIASLMGIANVVVAVNKMDLVNYSKDLFDEISKTFCQFAGSLNFRDVTAVPISALKGDMIVERGDKLSWYAGPTLMDRLETLAIDEDLNLHDLRFPVQWVCRPGTAPDHDFRGYAGRIESGVVAIGDSVTVLPSGRSSHVKQILTMDGALKRALAPQSVTLLLENDIDISRGDMIVKNRDGARVARAYEAELCWFDARPLDLRRRYSIKHTTKTVKALIPRVRYLVDVSNLRKVEGKSELYMNDIARVEVTVQQPLVIDSYIRNRSTGSFIVIDDATHNTVAAGMIV